jgi:hypothetical protein
MLSHVIPVLIKSVDAQDRIQLQPTNKIGRFSYEIYQIKPTLPLSVVNCFTMHASTMKHCRSLQKNITLTQRQFKYPLHQESQQTNTICNHGSWLLTHGAHDIFHHKPPGLHQNHNRSNFVRLCSDAALDP